MKNTEVGYASQPEPARASVYPRSPIGALVLSALIPGVGSIYGGKTGMGILILTLFIVSSVLCLALIGFVLVPIVWVWGMIDAFHAAQKWNRARGINS